MSERKIHVAKVIKPIVHAGGEFIGAEVEVWLWEAYAEGTAEPIGYGKSPDEAVIALLNNRECIG